MGGMHRKRFNYFPKYILKETFFRGREQCKILVSYVKTKKCREGRKFGCSYKTNPLEPVIFPDKILKRSHPGTAQPLSKGETG